MIANLKIISSQQYIKSFPFLSILSPISSPFILVEQFELKILAKSSLSPDEYVYIYEYCLINYPFDLSSPISISPISKDTLLHWHQVFIIPVLNIGSNNFPSLSHLSSLFPFPLNSHSILNWNKFLQCLFICRDDRNNQVFKNKMVDYTSKYSFGIVDENTEIISLCSAFGYLIDFKCYIPLTTPSLISFHPPYDNKIKKIVYCLSSLIKYPLSYTSLPSPLSSLLLVGISGIGKTHFIHQIIQIVVSSYNYPLPILTISLATLSSPLFNSVLSCLLFIQKILNKYPPIILIIDHIDDICRYIEKENEYFSLLSTLFSIIDNKNSGVFIFATSFTVSNISSLISHFDDIIYLSPPSYPERLSIVTHLFKNIFNEDFLVNLASSTSGFIPIDFQNLSLLLSSRPDYPSSVTSLIHLIKPSLLSSSPLSPLSPSSYPSFNNIIGLDRAKKFIDLHFLSPISRSPSISVHLLIYGDTGTGKTYLCQSLVQYLFDIGFWTYSIRLDQLLHGELGESEKFFSSLFQQAQSVVPSVLFIDEFHSFFSFNDELSSRLLSTFLYHLDNPHPGFHIIGVTNQPHLLDKFLSFFLSQHNRCLFSCNRFHVLYHLLYPSPNERQSRLVSLQQALKLSDEEIKRMVEMTKGFSQSQLSHFIQEKTLHLSSHR